MESGCSCNKDPTVTMIRMGTQLVGLVGLMSLFEEWLSASKSPDDLEGDEILTCIKRKTYVSQNSEREYIDAVQSAYAAFWRTRKVHP